MSLIRRPSPLAEVLTVRDAMERLFDERFMRPIWRWDAERSTAPALDLFTTPEAVIAKVALPGVKPEDVDVSITGDVVAITGSFREEAEKTEAGYVHKELGHGTFARSFVLPAPIKAEAAAAVFEHGVLTLTLPKVEEVKPTHVKVAVTA